MCVRLLRFVAQRHRVVATTSPHHQTSALVDLSIDFGDLPFSMRLAHRLS
jgi:hypothetical protein